MWFCGERRRSLLILRPDSIHLFINRFNGNSRLYAAERKGPIELRGGKC